MTYIGDFVSGANIVHKFTTRDFSTGAPFNLANAVAAVYKDGNATLFNTGVTLTTSYNNGVGLHELVINAANATRYTSGNEYAALLTAGTVNSVSVANEVIATFSIQNRGVKQVSGDVTGNVSGSVGSVTGNVGNVSGNVGGSVAGSVGSVTNNVTVGAIANNAITAVTINAAAFTGAKFGNDVDIRSVTGNVGNVTSNVGGSVAGSVGSVTGNVGNVTGNIGGNVAGSVGSVTGNVGNVTGNLGGTVATVTAVTNLNAQLIDAAVSTRATPAQVKANVVAALSTDTYAEPGQGTPAASLDLANKLNYLFKAWRNKTTQTNNTLSLFNDDTVTVDQKATVSDVNNTYTRGEIATGP